MSRFRAVLGCYQRGDLDGVDRIVQDIGLLVDTVGLPYIRYEYALAVAGRELRAGNAAAAEAACEAVLEHGTAAGAPEILASYGGVLYQTRQHQGRLDEIAELIMQAARDMPSLPAFRSTIAWMLCELGRTDEAREHLAEEAANGFEYPYNYLWLVTGVNFIEAAVSTADQPTTRLFLNRLAPYAHHILCTVPLVSGTVARPLGRAATLLGEYDQAEEWFASAHEAHTRLRTPFWLALGQLDHADLCLARRADGDIDHARNLATTAAATAAEYGCAGLTRRAQQLLSSI
jgi:tetratricopeptide (TPR) repeat protein